RVAAQAGQVEHPDAFEFDLQQSSGLELVQRLVGPLARNGGKQGDLVLRELDERFGVRIQVGIEQAGEAACDARVRSEQPVEFRQADEQAQAGVHMGKDE